MARRARPTLQLSSVSDSAKRNDTVAASNHSPIAIAPTTATVISRCMSGRRLRAANHALTTTNRAPRRAAARYAAISGHGIGALAWLPRSLQAAAKPPASTT